MTVGTYSPWEPFGQSRSARRREALRRPQREERGGAYCGGSRTTCYLGLKSIFYGLGLVVLFFVSFVLDLGLGFDICGPGLGLGLKLNGLDNFTVHRRTLWVCTVIIEPAAETEMFAVAMVTI